MAIHIRRKTDGSGSGPSHGAKRKKFPDFVKIDENGISKVDVEGTVAEFVKPVKATSKERVADLLEDKEMLDFLLHLCDLGLGEKVVGMVSLRYSCTRIEAEEAFNAAYAEFYREKP